MKRNILLFELFVVFFLSNGLTHENCQNNSGLSIVPIIGRFEHSEGPHWDHRTRELYFVDIDKQNVCRFNYLTKHLSCIYIANGPVGVAVPVKGRIDQLVAGSGTDFVLITWNRNNNLTNPPPRTLAVVDRDRNGTRWNDGKVDSLGRFWGGTIGPEKNSVVVPDQASLYLIDSQLKPRRKLSPVTNSNGLAWNYLDNTFYYIDTPTLQVVAYDFEPIGGVISNKRVAFDLKKNKIVGLPDGMTIDTAGNLWIALYNGGGVVNVNPYTGEVLKFLRIPVEKVTSCTFGGPKYQTLYITTSSRDLSEEELQKQPYAGYVFAVQGLGVRGLPANSFIL